ncbi:uncharacterized protein [Procambarus clarkii]|uniref:uncharacterized protein n=1 Tax=Procambarus clarkii TaxID=6728 RepID=UPI00374242F2
MLIVKAVLVGNLAAVCLTTPIFLPSYWFTTTSAPSLPDPDLSLALSSSTTPPPDLRLYAGVTPKPDISLNSNFTPQFDVTPKLDVIPHSDVIPRTDITPQPYVTPHSDVTLHPNVTPHPDVTPRPDIKLVPDITQAYGPPPVEPDNGLPDREFIDNSDFTHSLGRSSLYSLSDSHSIFFPRESGNENHNVLPVFQGDESSISGQLNTQSTLISHEFAVTSRPLSSIYSQPDSNSIFLSEGSTVYSQSDYPSALSSTLGYVLSQPDPSLKQASPDGPEYSQPDSHSNFLSDEVSIFSQSDHTSNLPFPGTQVSNHLDQNSVFSSNKRPISFLPDQGPTLSAIRYRVNKHQSPHSIFISEESPVTSKPEIAFTQPTTVYSQPDSNSVFVSTEAPVSSRPDLGPTLSSIRERVNSQLKPYSIALSNVDLDSSQRFHASRQSSLKKQASSHSDSNSVFPSDESPVSSRPETFSTHSSIPGRIYSKSDPHSISISDESPVSNRPEIAAILSSTPVSHASRPDRHFISEDVPVSSLSSTTPNIPIFSDQHSVSYSQQNPNFSQPDHIFSQSSIPSRVYSQPDPHSIFFSKNAALSSQPDPHSIILSDDHQISAQKDHSQVHSSFSGNVFGQSNPQSIFLTGSTPASKQSVTPPFRQSDHSPTLQSLPDSIIPSKKSLTLEQSTLIHQSVTHDRPGSAQINADTSEGHLGPIQGHRAVSNALISLGSQKTHERLDANIGRLGNPFTHSTHTHTQSAHDHELPAKYDFTYIIKDEQSGNDFGHQESSDGYNTQGSYYVQLPDGRLQRVTYTVSGDSGYVAQVAYEGQAQYPAPTSYSASGSSSSGSSLPAVKYKL